MSPYRGRLPQRDDEPPPDFRAPSTSARDKAFHWMMGGAVASAATFVTAPLVSAAFFAAGFVAGTVAYLTHDRRRRKPSKSQ
jgi:hypothetical protein